MSEHSILMAKPAISAEFIHREIFPIANKGDAAAIKQRIDGLLNRVAEPIQRHVLIEQLREDLDREEKRLLSQKEALYGKRSEMRLAVDILNELITWEGEGGSTTLQAAVSSRAHELARAFQTKSVFGVHFRPKEEDAAGAPPLVNYEEEKDKGGEVFVVEHDWAAAFAGAEDYDGGGFRLPYDRCVFEFCYGGRRLILRARQTPEQHEPEAQAFLELCTARRGGWVCLTAPTDKCYDLVAPAILQMKAICVSLEAEITYADAIRIPEKLRKARERDGKLPPFDHHVVRLHRRPRAARYEGEHEPGPRKRLHFRRGHWRHYASHRTWIKWTLCGNPDLGFVDKEYRL